MEVSHRRPSCLTLALALMAAAAIAAAPAPADAKKNPRVGSYRGEIELPSPPPASTPATGGTVSFRITKNRKVVGFTATDVPVYALFIVENEQGSSFVEGEFESRMTFSVPTMSLESVARFYYDNRPTVADNPPGAERYVVSGKPGGGPTRLKGYIYYSKQEFPGPHPQPDPNSGRSTFKQEWTAEKVGGKKKKRKKKKR
jgi:hypothetical protein